MKETYVMSRVDYAHELAAALDEFSCQQYFGVSRDLLDSDFMVWNQSLECAYQEYLDSMEEEEA